MAHPTAVILVVGLNQSLIGGRCPRISAFANDGVVRRVRPVLPAVTCSVQASMLTGRAPGGPGGHGVVANGYYHRELNEVHFWKQSNRLVAGEKVWETAKKRDPAVTCANLFWWFNMASSVDYSVTPRPIYKADGRKIPDVYTHPPDLRDGLQASLGQFPLFQFWGPGASIASSQWIAQAAIHVHQQHRPTLNLVYLPHLDYALQKLGPEHRGIPNALAEIDRVVAQLLDYYHGQGVRVMLVSEYGIEPVDEAIPINRHLRQAGLLSVRQEQGLELLDPGASAAFAVADHQVAHVYVNDTAQTDRVAQLCRGIPGVEQTLTRQDQAVLSLDHPRAGGLLLVAQARRWFSYDYWLDDSRAPDFARTVDIHRKPGYDPLELFIDPAIRMPKLKIAWKLACKRLGFRTLMDVVPLDTSLVRGSHGRVDQDPLTAPVLITQTDTGDRPDEIPCQAVCDVILEHLFTA